MRIDEVEQASDGESGSGRLAGLAKFLAGRAEDTNGPKQIDKATFIELSKRLGTFVTKDQLPELFNKPPLNNMFEPVDPNSDKLMFKGAEPVDVGMPVNKAQDVVAQAAKKAMNKDRGV
jgi:hypothetical protein